MVRSRTITPNSRTGGFLIFVRVNNVTGRTAVFRMRLNHTDIRQLTPGQLSADNADLSPSDVA